MNVIEFGMSVINQIKDIIYLVLWIVNNVYMMKNLIFIVQA